MFPSSVYPTAVRIAHLFAKSLDWLSLLSKLAFLKI